VLASRGGISVDRSHLGAPSVTRHPRIFWILALSLPIMLACGSSHASATVNPATPRTSPISSPLRPDSSPTPTAIPSTPATATPTLTPTIAPTAAPAPVLVGFGATDAVWNANHTADSDFAPGAVYNPDPNLPTINGHTGAGYVTVQHTHGQVLGYGMNLLPNTGIEAAKATTMGEFPGDAAILWFMVKDTCAQMEVKSPAVGSALSDPTIGDSLGLVFIELDTVHTDGTASYDAQNVNEGLVGLGRYNTAAEGPAC
jgi:hypothetical protein